METFEVEMRHDRASLTALSHMQYDLFCQRNRMARGFLSLTLIVIAILYGGGSWWSLLIIAYACYLTTSTYASSNRTAHRIADQLEQAGQPLPASRYTAATVSRRKPWGSGRKPSAASSRTKPVSFSSADLPPSTA